MLFVRKGTVELQSEPGQPYWIANPGDVLGIPSILTGTPQQLTGIAETDVEVGLTSPIHPDRWNRV